MKKRTWLVGIVLSLALGLAACGPGTAEPEEPPTQAPAIEEEATATEPMEEPSPMPAGPQGTLTVALSAEAESMDPFFVYQQAGRSVMEALFDTLVGRDFDGATVPGLATDWEIVDDTTLEFHLREGVTFHNGEPFTADAVKFTIERILDEEVNSALRSNYLSIESVEVVDDYTVRLSLAQPDGTIFDRLAELYILAPEYTQASGGEFIATNPVGTGPFSFVEWVPDDHVTLAANPDYYEGGWKGQPQVAEVVFRPITEASTRVSELIAGGVDIVQDLPPDQIEGVTQSGLEVSSSTTPNQTYVFVTADDPESPFSNQLVRQAINHAVDVETIVDSLFAGFGERIASPIGPASLGYSPDVEPYAYDPAQAQALLDEAGFGDGLSVTMDVTTADPLDPALAVAGQLSDVGIEVEIRELELAQFNDNWVSKAQSPMWRARWGSSPDPHSIELFSSCAGFITRYCNEEATELINAAKSTLDQQERAEIYSQLSQILHDDPVGIYLWTTTQHVGLSSEVQDFDPHVSLSIIVSGVSLDR